MCTVSFIPTRQGVLLTSNRDEQYARLPAGPPAVYHLQNASVMYPKDATAGGTWIAATEQGAVAVLLNGGYVPHTPHPPYRHSRGKIITDVLSEAAPLQSLQHYDCRGLEPFTLVLYTAGHLYECRWTGTIKHLLQKDATRPHIWSSATLYSPAVMQQREEWFRTWLQAHSQPNQMQVMQFHRQAGNGDAANSLCMNRPGQTHTVSITSVAVSSYAVSMKYIDIITGRQYKTEKEIQLVKDLVQQART